ncbi:MAG: hypothetical protein JWN95_1772 [Frankiales bacterium]|nr:hypothetical protein [Frankiales bacterium]
MPAQPTLLVRTIVLPLATAVVAVVGLSACTKASPSDGGSNTPATGSATVPATGLATPPGSASIVVTPTPTPTPTATTPVSLGGTCDDLLPVSRVNGAVGKPVVGTTAYVVGVAEPNIGRLIYLNCRYGIAKRVKGKPAPGPLLEVGVSLYKTAAQASSRVQATVDDYASQGATSRPVAIGQFPGTLLVGFGSPTLVVNAGPRTVAVTLSTRVVGAAKTATALRNVASMALDGTTQFSQGGPVAVTPTPGPTDSLSPSPAAS